MTALKLKEDSETRLVKPVKVDIPHESALTKSSPVVRFLTVKDLESRLVKPVKFKTSAS
jgi:hypothetical protein